MHCHLFKVLLYGAWNNTYYSDNEYKFVCRGSPHNVHSYHEPLVDGFAETLLRQPLKAYLGSHSLIHYNAFEIELDLASKAVLAWNTASTTTLLIAI